MNGKLFRKLVLLCGAGLIPLCAFGQTAKGSDYASQFDAYAGFTYLESPQINLAERGFHIQTGYNWKPWLAMGFDYSNANGTLNLIPAYLPTALKNEAELLQGVVSMFRIPPDLGTSTTHLALS